jgi:diguanylate cyclase (GGDEF)-like protein
MNDNNPAKLNEDILEIIEHVWAKGVELSHTLPADSENDARLKKLITEILAAQHQALAMANGDLSHTFKIKGTMAGALKTLQANLRHLTWQTQMIAQGDFSQRVDFMGEFAESFNTMVHNLEEARTRLKEREMALRQANTQLQNQIEEIQCLQSQLREQAIRDPLTQLFNRRYLQETLERELASAQRDLASLAVILLDIDHFKLTNDTHGHHAGDLMLQSLASILRDNTRQMDVACRYGGEEFVIVMPGAPLDAAEVRAEQLRVQFERLSVTYDSFILQATISLGVSAFPRHGSTGDALLHAADDALYAAKAAGRNRVVIANG